MRKESTLDIFSTPGFLVNRLAHEMTVALDRKLKQYNVTLSQWKVLLVLWESEGRSQVELQELLGVEGASMTGLLQRMEHCGLVQRKPDQVDKRMLRVYSSEQGRALKSVIAPLIDEVSEQAYQGFSDDECVFLTRLLQRSLQNFAQK